MSVVHEIIEGVEVEVSADTSQLQLRGPVPDQTHGPIRGEQTHGPIRGEHCPPIPAHLTRQTGQVRVWQWSFLKVPRPGLNTVSTVAQEL